MKLKDIIPYVLLVILTIVLINKCNKEPEIIEVPVQIKIPVPVVEHHYDTIYEPKPIPVKVRVLDSKYYKMYTELKDSVDRDEFVKDALTLREYKNVFNDSIQTITTYNKVRGYLTETTLSYVTKPRTIEWDTIIKVKDKKDFNIAIGAEAGFKNEVTNVRYSDNAQFTMDDPFIVKGNLFINTKKILYNISYDTDDRWWIGAAFKPF